MASLQPIKLYAHKKGPNPWKVALILEELGLPYETTYLEFPDAKVEPYISLNPNGKLPAIQDPNHSIELFESGAIIEYLCGGPKRAKERKQRDHTVRARAKTEPDESSQGVPANNP
ncbi:hypothetical protein MY10362_009754 [Beauveria mimosiformis]